MSIPVVHLRETPIFFMGRIGDPLKKIRLKHSVNMGAHNAHMNQSVPVDVHPECFLMDLTGKVQA